MAETPAPPAWLPPPPGAPQPPRPKVRQTSGGGIGSAKAGPAGRPAPEELATTAPQTTLGAEGRLQLASEPLILPPGGGAQQPPAAKAPAAKASAAKVPAAPAAAPPAQNAGPADLKALRRQATKAHEGDDLAGAIRLYRQVLDREPDNSQTWSNLGVALRKAENFEAAAAAQRRAVEIKPEEGSYWSNLGNALKDLDRVEEAIEAHRKAVQLRPREPSWRHNFGVALREAGLFQEALDEFDAAIRLAPENDNYRWDRSIILLHLGRWEEGWIAYEWRYRLKEMPERRRDYPRWLGEDFKGRTLVLHPEQGFGDTILATRWLPAVKARGGKVVLIAKPPLLRLFQGLPGVDEVISTEDARLHGVHTFCSLMDLPRVFMPTPETAPPPPKLTIPAAAQARAREWLKPAGERFTVGVVWSGSVTFKNNRKRAVGVERFLPLAEIPGVQLVSLQKGPREGDLDSSGANGVMLDVGRRVQDFAETAAVIDQLDLVIMTNSSVAHLCGTLGKPIWNLLNYVPYWLYGWETETTPWYPSMRLIRQPKPSDWDSVFARVTEDLTAAVAAKRAGRWPG